MRCLVLTVCAACSFSSPIRGNAGDDAPPAPGPDATLVSDAKSPIDADPCEGPCEAAGGTCNKGTCVIDVTTTGDIMCPAGLPCLVNCNATGACDGNVDCSAATTCTINCAVAATCNTARFDCHDVGCTVYCRAVNTCNISTIDVTHSQCDLDCCAANTCNQDVATPQTCSFSNNCL
jgi:hypothetical protein